MRTACMVFLAATTMIAAACDNDDNNPPAPTAPISAPPPAPSPSPTPAPSPAPSPAPTPAPTPTPTTPPPPAAPTFTQVYNDVITPICLPCHATQIGVQLGQLDMSTKDNAFNNLVNKPTAGASCAGQGTRVVPGNHQQSIMYLKVSLTDPAPCGAKMPFGLPPLAQAQVDEISKWIDDGAKNN